MTQTRTRGPDGPPGSGPRISRRALLGLAAFGAVGAGAGGIRWYTGRGAGLLDVPAAAGGVALPQPAVLDSAGGRLRVELTAAPGARLPGLPDLDNLAAGLLGYGVGADRGTSPGPTLRVRPGDELSVRLTNALAEPTSLHTHGLRVSPEGNGDNPFVHVEPGASFEYVFRVPPDHPTGTFWYHPHSHGSTAVQLFGGLAGALLVVPGEEPAGDGPAHPEVDADLVLVVTDTTLRTDGSVAAAGGAHRDVGREGHLVLVNGALRPVLAAAPGETQRWRVVNACASRVFELRLDGHTVHQIALDGSYLPAPAAVDAAGPGMRLAPGNRADVLVRAAAPGSYDLLADPVSRGRLGSTAPGEDTVPLVRLDVDGPAAAPGPLPAALPAASRVPGDVTRTRQLDFSQHKGMNRMEFGFGNAQFDPGRVDQSVSAGATEDWVVNNTGPLAHPFHLHVWPFVVLATSDGHPPAGVLQDVVLVPARGWARIRIPFPGVTGRTVYHCHVADHADAGMMGTISVS